MKSYHLMKYCRSTWSLSISISISFLFFSSLLYFWLKAPDFKLDCILVGLLAFGGDENLGMLVDFEMGISGLDICVAGCF